MISVAISGKFDPIHEGHIKHLLAAAELGDHVYVIVQSDEVVNLMKGYSSIPFLARFAIISGLLLYYRIEGHIVPSVDKDGSSCRTLVLLRPNIYAKGGNITPDNMLQSEVDICREIGCEIVYGVGGGKINSSSSITVNKGDPE